MRNTHRQSAPIRGPGSSNQSGAHYSGSGPEMTNNGDSAHTSETCFDMCETLKPTTQGKNANDLDESVRTTPEGLERCVDYDKERVESHKPETKQMLSTLTTPRSEDPRKSGGRSLRESERTLARNLWKVGWVRTNFGSPDRHVGRARQGVVRTFWTGGSGVPV